MLSVLPTISETAKPPRRKRWIPVSVRIFGAMMFLLFVGSILRVVVPIYRQQAAIREIEKLGGRAVREYGGRHWLAQWLGYKLMESFDPVTDVDLHSTAVTDGTLARLTCLTALESLSLANTRITDAGLAHLKHLTCLKTLDLQSTQVTDSGLDNLTGMKNLHLLWLDNTHVSDPGLAKLACLTRMETLWIPDTFATDVGVAELQRKMPECLVMFWRQADADAHRY